MSVPILDEPDQIQLPALQMEKENRRKVKIECSSITRIGSELATFEL